MSEAVRTTAMRKSSAPTMDESDSKAIVLTEGKSVAKEEYELAWAQAKAISLADIIPQAYRGNVPNCLIALDMARRLNASPMLVMQNLHVIKGRPSWSAPFLVASINDCGRYTALRYEISGEGMERGCVAWAIERETGDRIEGPRVTMQMAKAEGWLTKDGSKWKTMEDLMLRYRAAAFFARTNCPELTMGLHTADELEDMDGRRAPRSERPSAVVAREALAAAVEGATDVTPPEVGIELSCPHCDAVDVYIKYSDDQPCAGGCGATVSVDADGGASWLGATE